jgi:hypothetical protein
MHFIMYHLIIRQIAISFSCDITDGVDNILKVRYFSSFSFIFLIF